MKQPLNNRFLYWCLGWYLMFRRPISRPIDLGTVAERLIRDDSQEQEDSQKPRSGG